MTSKEKAIELVDSYKFMLIDNYTCIYDIQKCALILVDNIINECKKWEMGEDDIEWEEERFKFWEEVKIEIENIHKWLKEDDQE